MSRSHDLWLLLKNSEGNVKQLSFEALIPCKALGATLTTVPGLNQGYKIFYAIVPRV